MESTRSRPPSYSISQRKSGQRRFFVRRGRRGGGKKGISGRLSTPSPPVQLKVGILPNYLKLYERFFAALLRNSPEDFVTSASNERNADELWSMICRRVGLQPLKEAIEPKYSDPCKHFDVRAALVLEESRHIIAEALAKRWSLLPTTKSSRPKHSSSSMKVSCESEERDEQTGHVTMTLKLEGQSQFTKEQLFQLRHATVLELLPCDMDCGIGGVSLACILSGNNRDDIEKNSTLSAMVFRQPSLVIHDKKKLYRVTPICGLISEIRQFDACTSKYAKKIPFVGALMGHWPKHTRFEYSDDNSEIDEVEEDDVDKNNENGNDAHIDIACVTTTSKEVSSRDSDGPNFVGGSQEFKVPQLNETQQEASRQFLESKPGTITLVQGPPGTGKSTLIVAIICQYLIGATLRCLPRLMVCAPTNKAVAVVADRLLNAVDGNNSKYNILLVGDVDKLLETGDTHATTNSQLQSIFIYTWQSGLIEDYRSLRNFVIRQRNQPESLTEYGRMSSFATKLQERLYSRLPDSSNGEVGILARKISKEMERVQRETRDSGDISLSILASIADLITQLEDMPKDDVCRELLKSANVVFCTLASAGSTLFKWTSKIDDLIVDEASAATESELCIPFHLKPKRLLAIGDPMQLPATVFSKKAVALGFDTSLHERLMNNLRCPHIMLDVQYRMKPEISVFPSQRFYQGRIMDGENVTSPQYRNPAPLLDGEAYSFLDVEGREEQAICGSYRNLAEAQLVVDLIQNLRTLPVTGRRSWHSLDRIRVITFYSAQVALIKQLLAQRGLRQVLVATVDSSQGCEADVVVVSFVRSNSGGHPSQKAGFIAGFLNDDRRMNVALTRARYQLICIGNAGAMSNMVNKSTIRRLISDAEHRECVVSQLSENTYSGVGKRKQIYSKSKDAKRSNKKVKRWHKQK